MPIEPRVITVTQRVELTFQHPTDPNVTVNITDADPYLAEVVAGLYNRMEKSEARVAELEAAIEDTHSALGDIVEHEGIRRHAIRVKARLVDAEFHWGRYKARVAELERKLRVQASKHGTQAKERDRYREALERIANQDYRGNRSAESIIAHNALKG